MSRRSGSGTPREQARRALATVQTVLSVHVRAGAAHQKGFLDSAVYEATCCEPLCDVVRSLPEVAPHLLVLALQWLPPGWYRVLEPEAQLLEEPGGVDPHSARWLALLDGLESPPGLVEGVAGDLIIKSLALARTQRIEEKGTSLLLRAAMHLCTGGAASTFGELPLWASARWDGLVAKLSGLHFDTISIAFSKQMRAAIGSQDQEDLAGLLRVGAVLRARLAKADNAVLLQDILADQLPLLAQSDITPSLRCAQLHMLSCLLRQLDFPSAGVGTGSGVACSRFAVDETVRDLAECSGQLFHLIEVQLFPHVEAIMRAIAASELSDAGEHDVVHCCMVVLSSIICGAPRPFFEARGAQLLSLVLRTVRDAAAVGAAMPCRKALVLVWQMMRGPWSPDPQAVEGHAVHFSDSTPSPFPWSLLHREVRSSWVLRGAAPSECHWMLQADLRMHRSVRSVFGAAMRTDDAPHKWMTPVIAVLLDSQVLPQPEDHESLQVLAAVMVQVASHDLGRFNEQIMPTLLDVSRMPAAATKDASILLATACTRIIADESSGFAEHARKTLLHARGAGTFDHLIHKTRVSYIRQIDGIIHEVKGRLQADGASLQEQGDWSDYAKLDPSYEVRLGGADWSQITDHPRRFPSGHHDDCRSQVDPQKPHQAIASACFTTVVHCVKGALEDETARVEPDFDRSLDALTGTLWALVRHRVCSRSAAALLVTCARMRRRQRCRLLRAGLELLTRIHMDAAADQQAVLGVLSVCMDAWRRDIARVDEAAELDAMYRSMYRDKNWLFLVNGIDAAALVLACSAAPRVRVMALRLATTMAALQRDILDAVAKNKAAVADFEHRQWVAVPSSDDTWGTAHVCLGAALDELAVPVVESCAPETLPRELSGITGLAVLAHAAVNTTNDAWGRCLGEMGARLVESIGGATLDFAREWIFRLFEGILSNDSKGHRLRARTGHVQSSVRSWQQCLLLSLGPRLVDATDEAELRRGDIPIKIADRICRDEKSRAEKVKQELRVHLCQCWDTYFNTGESTSRDVSDSSQLTAAQHELVQPVCLSTNWRSINAVVQSLLDWCMSVAGTSTELNIQPHVLNILRHLASHPSFERACSNLGLVEALLKFIARDNTSPAVRLPQPGAHGELHAVHIAQSRDYTKTVTKLAQGILVSTVRNEAVGVWSVENRQRVIEQLQCWAGVATAAPLVPAPEEAGPEAAQLIQSLQRESIRAIIAIVQIAPLVISDEFWRWAIEAENMGNRVLRWIVHHHFDEVARDCLDIAFGDAAQIAEIASFAVVSNFVATPMEPTPQLPTHLAMSNGVPVETQHFQTKIRRMAMVVDLVHFSLASLGSTSTCIRVGGLDLLQVLLPWAVKLLGFDADHQTPSSDTVSAHFSISRTMRRSILIGDAQSRDNAMAIAKLASDYAPMLAGLLFEHSFERLRKVAVGSGTLMDADWMWEMLQPWGVHINIFSGPAHGFMPYVLQTLSPDARDMVKSTKYSTVTEFFDDLVDASLRSWHRSCGAAMPSNSAVLRVWDVLCQCDREGNYDGASTSFILGSMAKRLHTMQAVDQELMYCAAALLLRSDKTAVVKSLSEQFCTCLQDASFDAAPSRIQSTNQLGAMRVLVELMSRGHAASLQKLIPQILVFLLLRLDSVVKCDTAPLVCAQPMNQNDVGPIVLQEPPNKLHFGPDNSEQYVLQCMLSRLLLVIAGGLGVDGSDDKARVGTVVEAEARSGRSGTSEGWEACSELEDIAEQLTSHRACILVWDVSPLGNSTADDAGITWTIDEYAGYALRAIAAADGMRPRLRQALMDGVGNVDIAAVLPASHLLHNLHNTLMATTVNSAGAVPLWATGLLNEVAKMSLELTRQSSLPHIQIKTHQIYRSFLSSELLNSQHMLLPDSEQLESMVGCVVDILDTSEPETIHGEPSRIGAFTESLNTVICCAHAGSAVGESLFVGVCACLLRCGVQILPSMRQTVHWNAIRSLSWCRGIDLFTVLLSHRTTREWLCNPDPGRDQYMAKLCQRLGFNGIEELLQANAVDEPVLMAPQVSLAVTSGLLLQADPSPSYHGGLATAHFTLALSTILFLHGSYPGEAAESGAAAALNLEFFSSICADLAEMMGRVCGPDHAAITSTVAPGNISDGGTHSKFSEGLAERLRQALHTAAAQAPDFYAEMASYDDDIVRATEPAADRFLRAVGQRLAAIYLPFRVGEAVSFLMDVVQHSTSSRRVSSAMAMAHVFLTEHPEAATYAPHFQPLIQRAVQWLGSTPVRPQGDEAPQLEHFRRRGYCVQIVSKLHRWPFIDHRLMMQRLPEASPPWHIPLNATQTVNAWGFVLALNPSASAAIRAAGVSPQPSATAGRSLPSAPTSTSGTSVLRRGADGSTSAQPHAAPSPARKPRLLPPTPPPRPSAAPDNLPDYNSQSGSRVQPTTPVMMSSHDQNRVTGLAIVTPSSVGSSPARTCDNSIDAHNVANAVVAMMDHDVALEDLQVGELPLEQDGSWSSESQESCEDLDSLSEWGGSTPLRSMGGRRFSQQELDEYEHELALDISASGVEALVLVEDELRDEKVRELLAAVGATPEEEETWHVALRPRVVNLLRPEGVVSGSCEAGGARSSADFRAKFAHLLG